MSDNGRSTTAVLNKTAIDIATYLPHRIYWDNNSDNAAKDGADIISLWLADFDSERKDETTLKTIEYLVKSVDRDKKEYPNAAAVLRLLAERYHGKFKDNHDYAVMLSRLQGYN